MALGTSETGFSVQSPEITVGMFRCFDEKCMFDFKLFRCEKCMFDFRLSMCKIAIEEVLRLRSA